MELFCLSLAFYFLLCAHNWHQPLYPFVYLVLFVCLVGASSICVFVPFFCNYTCMGVCLFHCESVFARVLFDEFGLVFFFLRVWTCLCMVYLQEYFSHIFWLWVFVFCFF